MPKLLYIASEDWAFVSHFLPMVRAARENGFDVVVACRVRRHAHRIESEGARVLSLPLARGSLNPIRSLLSMVSVFRLLRRERPDIVHCIAIMPIVLGGLAAKLAGVKAVVLAPTGLGHLWIENDIMTTFLRALIRLIAGRVLRGPGTRYLFENRDDPREFHLDPDDANVTLIGGAGVDPACFPVRPEPRAPPFKVAVVARMIRPKGIAEAVESTRRARVLGAPLELHLFGEPDLANPRTLTETELRKYAAEPCIYWHGQASDISQIWRDHHIAMLLSYREGLPRALVEAAASGRPTVATDVPGCREVARDGLEGILVPLGDVEAAARALVLLANNPQIRARMGAAANARFREHFTEDAIRTIVARLYLSMMAG